MVNEVMSQEEYKSLNGTLCPFCRSPHCAGDETRMGEGDGTITFWMHCNSCGKGWQEIYQFVRWQPEEEER